MAHEKYRVIEQWYNQAFSHGYYESVSGGRIRYSISKKLGTAATLVVVTGRTEFLEKYQELCWDLRDSNYLLCLFEHIGQGGSGRLLDDPQKGHIDDFLTYTADLDKFLKTIVMGEINRPVSLLAHSMGCTISTLFLEKNQELVDRVVMVSPMLQINTGAIFRASLVERISNLICRMGGQNSYVWGGGPHIAELHFEGNELTTDKDRFYHNLDLLRSSPELAIGSPTFGWLQQAYRAMLKAQKTIPFIRCPVLLLKGGRDRVVCLSAMDDFCRNAVACRAIVYPEARHEVLMESDHIRDAALAEIRNFIPGQ